MKYNYTTVTKLEKVFSEAEYVIRYERGNFQSGYCILEERKIIVLNKFLNVEGRINTLVDLLPKILINFDKLTLESQRIYEEVLKKTSAETP